jgi:cytochrome c biogenesis protein CcmG, thiol:disulfide interchange protein DsbE
VSEVALEPAPRRRAPYIAGAVAVVVVAFVAVLATGHGGVAKRGPSPLLGRPAPAIAGSTIDGRAFDLSTRKGSWVLVNFFSSTCTPCKQEHPELRAFVERGGRAELLTVVWTDQPANVQKFFAANGGSWPVVTDPQSRVSVAYGVTGVPETFVIDRTGVVRQHIVGATTAAKLDSMLTELGA